MFKYRDKHRRSNSEDTQNLGYPRYSEDYAIVVNRDDESNEITISDVNTYTHALYKSK